jgi:exopolysaccharide biosynthesis polyprenyl glycosylphosphotransferase
MKRKRNSTGTIMFMMSSVIVIVLAYIFWITWNDFYRKMVVDPFYEKGSLLLTLVYIIIYFLFSQIYGGHKIGYLKAADIVYSQSLSIILTNFITYMQLSLLAKKLVNPFALIIMLIIEIMVVVIWTLICNKIYYSIYPPINMLMIYSNENVISLMTKMKGHKDKYWISSTINISEGLKVVQTEIDKYEAVVICDLDSSDRNKIVKYCFKKSIMIYLTPKISDIIIQSADKLHILDTPLLLCKNQGLTFEQKLFKRATDIIISSIAIFLTLPFMIIVAAAIKIYDKGPIIFKQKRLTLNNRVFEIYKFRSMIVNAEKSGEARLASQNDDRITPVGKIIRKIRFDELPQLFNILKGDMSIVGPRPERPEIAELYIEVMPEFEFRTKVKAGLTGFAQVMGKYNTTPYDKLKLDLMYIGNYSMFLDLKMIIMTFKILFMSESTEGIGNGELLPELLALDKDK